MQTFIEGKNVPSLSVFYALPFLCLFNDLQRVFAIGLNEGDVRLVAGGSSGSGRVEIYHK